MSHHHYHHNHHRHHHHRTRVNIIGHVLRPRTQPLKIVWSRSPRQQGLVEYLTEARSPAHTEFECWRRSASAAEQQRYEKMRRGQKQAFRIQWAEKNLEVEVERFHANRSLNVSDKKKGIWMPLRKMAMELGYDMPAAVRYAKSCIMRGPTEYEYEVQDLCVRCTEEARWFV